MNPILDFILQDIQLLSAIIFVILMCVFLYVKRKKIETQKIAYPILYFFLYRTKLGLNQMDSISKRFPRIVKVLAYIGVVIGFIGMIFTTYMLLDNLYRIMFEGARVGAGVVQPFVQTEPGSFFFYVPFFYFIVSIFIIATVHEFSHGVVARLFNVKVKSSGFAFLSVIVPIIPAAFVEPEEKQVKKIKPMQQLGIFAAGPFSNILLAMLVWLSFFAIDPWQGSITDSTVYIQNLTHGDDVMYPAEQNNLPIGDQIVRIDGVEIENAKIFSEVMANTKPGQTINFVTNTSQYSIVLAEHPSADSGFLGVMPGQNTEYKEEFKASYAWAIPAIDWSIGLLFWLFLLNIAIGLINLIPLGPVDGGRMILVVLQKYVKKEELQKKIFGYISLVTLIILLGNIFLPSILNFLL